MAPKPPNARNRAGVAVAILNPEMRDVGGPEMAPKPPNARNRAGVAVAILNPEVLDPRVSATSAR
jgi:hypothetical protein